MELEVLGVGDAFTNVHHNTSFFVRSDLNILIDGPQGLFPLLRKRKIRRRSIDAVIVTHIHGDHVSGLETLLLWNRYILDRKTTIIASQLVLDNLRDIFFPSIRESFIRDYHEIVTLGFDEFVEPFVLEPERINPISDSLGVEFRHNWHPVPTLGLRLICDFGSISISGDTCYNPRLLEKLLHAGTLSRSHYGQLAGSWLWESDVIYHEVTDQPDSPHTFIGDLEALPPETKQKIRLIHFPDGLKSEELPLAEEGEKVSIGHQGIRIQKAKF